LAGAYYFRSQYPTARAKDCAAFDASLVTNAYLTAYGGVMFYYDSARQTSLSCDYDMVADLAVVGDVDHVVELDSIADEGEAQGCAVDAGVGTDLNIVADLDSAHLRELFPFAVHGDEAKTVGTDDRAGMDDRSFTYFDAVVDRNAGMDHRVLADLDVAADAATGVDLDAVSQR